MTHDRLATKHWPKSGGGGCSLLCSFLWEVGPYPTQCRLGRGLPRTKWYPDPSRRLSTHETAKTAELIEMPFELWTGLRWAQGNVTWGAH